MSTDELTPVELGNYYLLELADFLEYGQLGHQEFDFGHFNIEMDRTTSPGPACGGAGCALGECPVLWPEVWCFARTGDPVLRSCTQPAAVLSTLESARQWFVLADEDQTYHLFMPCGSRPDKYGGQDLRHHATALEVAMQIRTFVEHRRKGLIP